MTCEDSELINGIKAALLRKFLRRVKSSSQIRHVGYCASVYRNGYFVESCIGCLLLNTPEYDIKSVKLVDIVSSGGKIAVALLVKLDRDIDISAGRYAHDILNYTDMSGHMPGPWTVNKYGKDYTLTSHIDYWIGQECLPWINSVQLCER